MTYKIKIEIFEGPFDLLFHLIEKNEIDIYDIPMTEITEQYIAYIEDLEELNLDITSEFLIMAATLIEIKSKTLLPVQIVEHNQLELDNLDPREELVKRLLEYKKYKIIAKKLRDKKQNYQKLYFKPKEDLIFDDSDLSSFDTDYIDIKELFLALNRCIKKNTGTISSEDIIKEIQRSTITVEDKIKEIIKLLNREKKIRFQDMFSKSTTRIEIITTFLALLEIIRLGQVIIRQNTTYNDIIIEPRNIGGKGESTNGHE